MLSRFGRVSHGAESVSFLLRYVRPVRREPPLGENGDVGGTSPALILGHDDYRSWRTGLNYQSCNRPFPPAIFLNNQEGAGGTAPACATIGTIRAVCLLTAHIQAYDTCSFCPLVRRCHLAVLSAPKTVKKHAVGIARTKGAIAVRNSLLLASAMFLFAEQHSILETDFRKSSHRSLTLTIEILRPKAEPVSGLRLFFAIYNRALFKALFPSALNLC